MHSPQTPAAAADASQAAAALTLSPFSCPSAQPDMHEARVFGLLSGSAEQPRVAYLKQEAVIPAEAVPDTGDLKAIEVFRFAARCEEGRCAQYADGRCSLGQRLVDGLDEVVDSLPSCTIRPTCRWYAEQGRAACLRCPQVVTLVPQLGDRLSRAAALPSP
jgi:hypothetical protein